MIGPRRQPILVADSIALDFLNSIATPADVPVEWLGSGEDLLEWLNRANLVPSEVTSALRRSSLPGELDAAAAQARALREWFRDFVREHKGRHLRPIALEQLGPLNRVLERDEQYSEIVKAPRGAGTQGRRPLSLQVQRRWRSADTLLIPIARAMADLVCYEDFTQIKACEGATCTLLFLDRTHGRARRWCSMAACGNRAKQAAHRIRRRKN